MRLNMRAMVFGMGILWGVVVLFTGLANLIWSGYGTKFLELLASVYPGYEASGSIGDLITAVLYALADGGLFGLVFVWLYNRFLGSPTAISQEVKREAGVRYSPVEPPGLTS